MLLELETFLEAVSHKQKLKAIGPLERKLELELRALFGIQRRAVLARLGSEKSINAWNFVADETLVRMAHRFVRALMRYTSGAMNAGSDDVSKDIQPLIEAKAAFSLGSRKQYAIDYLTRSGATTIVGINETTSERIRNTIAKGLEQKLSQDRIAKSVGRVLGKYGVRARTIARTEIGNAYSEGALVQARNLQDTGVAMVKSWKTLNDSRVTDGCLENQAAGKMPIEQAFPSGHQRPTRFPGCRCDLAIEKAQK